MEMCLVVLKFITNRQSRIIYEWEDSDALDVLNNTRLLPDIKVIKQIEKLIKNFNSPIYTNLITIIHTYNNCWLIFSGEN